MGIFNSIGQVFSNRSNFKEYEKKQDETQARRNALAQKNPASAEQIERAKQEGKVLIDVIDIMDTHSEDVAEKTETATQVPESLLPFAAFLGSGLASAKFIMMPAEKASSAAYAEFSESEAVKDLIKNIREYAETNDIAELRNVYSYEFTDKKYLDELLEKFKGIKDSKKSKEFSKQAQELLDKYNNMPGVKNYIKKYALGAAVPFVALAASFVGFTLWATKLQVTSSRVARWQSRKQLEDPKYFVQYTPEQIEQAKANLQTEEEKDKGFTNKIFKKSEKASLIQVIKDNKKYKEWKKTDSDDSKKVDRQLTQEEILDAKKDQEVIQRVTRVINNKAEDYSENMEVAADVIIGGTPFLGAAVGGLVGFIANKTGMLNKFVENKVAKFADLVDDGSKKAIKESFEKLKNLKPKDEGYKAAKAAFNKAVFGSRAAGGGKNKVFGFKKLSTFILSTQGGRNKLLAGVGAIFTGIAGALIGLKLSKASARAGRYLAKRELENDPNNFIGYTEEELQQAGDVKPAKKSTSQKFKEYVTFLPRVIGEYFEYQKYVKNEAKQNRALKEELVKLDVTPEQLSEAKNMQRKMFNTFEKVDDKSQEYSESVEAATTIAKPAVSLMGTGVMLSPAIVAGIQIARGKLSVSKVIDKVTKFLGNKTKFLKGKFSNRYLNEVKENVSVLVSKTDIKADIPKSVESLGDLISGVKSKDIISGVKNQLSGLKNLISNSDEDTVKTIINEIDNSAIKFLLKDCDKKRAESILSNVEKILNNVPEKKLVEIIDELKKQYEKEPDKVLSILSDKSEAKKLFATKSLKIAGGAISGTWIAINMLITFAIESWLAKLQKEAGRLGVMKALDELNDPLYYANVEASPNSSNPQLQPAASETKNPEPQGQTNPNLNLAGAGMEIGKNKYLS